MTGQRTLGRRPHAKATCSRLRVPTATCYVRFAPNTQVRSPAPLGKMARGEIVIADYDKNGAIVGLELVGRGKPCQDTVAFTTVGGRRVRETKR